LTSFSNITFLDQELAKIKGILKNAPIDYYYPIPDKKGKIVYANEAQIMAMYGITIKQYLKNNNR
jgi:hypothetical protein